MQAVFCAVAVDIRWILIAIWQGNALKESLVEKFVFLIAFAGLAQLIVGRERRANVFQLNNIAGGIHEVHLILIRASEALLRFIAGFAAGVASQAFLSRLIEVKLVLAFRLTNSVV